MKNNKGHAYPYLPAGRRQAGFTLIEMLVVVAIIGLLSSVVVVGLGSARQNARDARRISDIRQIQNVLEVYYADSTKGNGAYPTTLEGLNMPKDPSSENNYGYTGGEQTYTLGACLEGDPPKGTNNASDAVFGSGSGFPQQGSCASCADSKAFCVKV